MSGGHFDYNQYRLDDIAVEIDDIIKNNDNKELDEVFKEPIGRHYPKEIIDLFKETAHTVRQARDMIQRVDWLLCGDDGEESFLSRWKEEVRPYWKDKN